MRSGHLLRASRISAVALGAALGVSLGAAGCVEGFTGSSVTLDLGEHTPPQAPAGQAPGPGELESDIHFRLYAVQPSEAGDSLFELQRFEIHKLVRITSPCFIDVGAHVPFPGLHVSQYAAKTAEKTGITDLANPPPGATMQDMIEAATAEQRMINVGRLAGDRALKAVTSASPGGYPAVDADCDGAGLPPPSCRDDASNARRLAACQAAWKADPALFEGTDRVLTSPLNGTTFGFVLGENPVTPTPVGGAVFTVPHALEGVDEYAIYFQGDGAPAPGTLFLHGRAERITRGVSHVEMESPFLPTVLEAQLAIFANLGEDDVHF